MNQNRDKTQNHQRNVCKYESRKLLNWKEKTAQGGEKFPRVSCSVKNERSIKNWKWKRKQIKSNLQA